MGERGSEALKKIGDTLIPIVVSAGSLISFVAFAGGVILWTRFNAIGVPPEQAVDAVPDGELIATGSVLLLLFGFFGALALISAFLVDRSARLTPGMAGLLLVLFAFEGTVAIVLVAGRSFWSTAADLVLFLPSVLGAAWVTAMGTFSVMKDDLRIREREQLDPKPNRGFLRPDEDTPHYEKATPWAWAPLAIVGLCAVAAAPMLVFDACDVVVVSVLGGLIALLLLSMLLLVWLDRRENSEAAACPDAKTTDEKAKEEAETKAEAAKKNKDLSEEIESRMYKHRPRRFALTTRGEVVASALLAVAVALPVIRLGNTWLLVALVAAAAITVGVRRVAWLANERLMWFGIALFLSVPLFGTVMTMARNLDEPRVQPVAIIRSTDGPTEAIQGLYVTESDERVYFANVATEGCGEDFKHDSSRLLWVPRDEVVAMSIGPAQDVKSAGRSAQEMSNALTPGIETSTGESVTLRADGEDDRAGSGGAVEGEAERADNRLETAGRAVRPEFGRGLRLEPETVVAGQTVELSRDVKGEEKGFGDEQGARSLRLNGVELPVQAWSREKITFRVPKKARSGVVEIECEALAGEPYLNVSRKPQAQISIRAVPGSNRVVFDGRRSSDDGEIVSREWRVSGLIRGEDKGRVARSLPPRTGFYRIRLTVTDDEEETDTETVRLLRLRTPQFEFNREAPESKRVLTDVLKAVSRLVAEDRRRAVETAEKDGGGWRAHITSPAKIEVAGHADDVGSFAYNARLSWRRALGVWRALDEKGVGQAWTEGAGGKPKLTVRGFGETCPLDPGGERLRKNRRVEVFVLSGNARMIFPRSCNAVYVKHASWGDTPP